MRTQISSGFLGLVVATAAVCVGCGDPDAPPVLKVYPVTGAVQLDGDKPLTSGKVILVSRERALEFEGKIEADGSFHIASPQGDGAPEGSYLVRIEADQTSLATGKIRTTARRSPVPFPVRYTNEETSDLSVTVKPGENKLEPFRLSASQRKADAKSSGRAKS